jgi:hypothetical protein
MVRIHNIGTYSKILIEGGEDLCPQINYMHFLISSIILYGCFRELNIAADIFFNLIVLLYISNEILKVLFY